MSERTYERLVLGINVVEERKCFSAKVAVHGSQSEKKCDEDVEAEECWCKEEEKASDERGLSVRDPRISNTG